MVSFWLETFPRPSWVLVATNLPGHLLAQTLISSGVLFTLINAEMINGNANDREVAQPSARASLMPPH